MRKIFQSENTEGVLLVDASNAFNSLNRSSALLNVKFLCPSRAPALINIYHYHAELYVADEAILSQEGTTQGDPLAMAMYALAVEQVWFADDATAGGHLDKLVGSCG